MFSLLHKEDRDYTGRLCYEYLLGEPGLCPHCRKTEVGRDLQSAREVYLPQIDRYFLSQGRVIDWAGRQAYIEYLTDITDTKRTQRQRIEMLQSITCGIVVSTADPAGSTYSIQYMNEGFCRLFESSEEALRERYKTDITVDIHPDDVWIIRKVASGLRRNRRHAEGTLRILFPGGRVKWVRVDVNGVLQADGMVTSYSTFYDVTTQVEQDQQLRDVIRNVPGGVCLYRWNGERLRPLVVSQRFFDLLGEEAAGEDLSAMENAEYPHVHPDDLPGLRKAVQEAFTKTGRMDHTYRMMNEKLGEYRWLNLQGITVPQADGTQLAYVSYADITEGQRMARELSFSERVLDTATEAAGLWVWRYDPATDRAYFSPRALQRFGLPEVLENYPRSWLERDYVLPEYREIYADAVRRMKEGAPRLVIEVRMRSGDGSVHWCEIRFVALPDEGGAAGVVVCTSRVIDFEKTLSAKYEMEKQKPSLGEKDLLFHAAFNLDTGVTMEYGYEPSGEQLEGRYPTQAQAIESVVSSAVGREQREKLLQYNDTAFLRDQMSRGKLSFALEYRRRLPDGRILWVRNLLHLVMEPNTRELLLFEYCYNIHEQKMAEEVLSFAMERDYERLACVDLRLGTMVQYGTYGDLEPNEVVDYDASRRGYAEQTVQPEDKPAFLADSAPQSIVEQVKKTGVYAFTTRIRGEDGRFGVVKTRFTAYDQENGIYIMARTDVTDLLREEERKNDQLREALALAQQANSAKSDFLSSMSHDIRTPMNAIMGMCNLALQDESDRVQVHESLSTINTSAELLLGLINNILDMSRIESGKMTLSRKLFSLTQQVSEAAQSYRALSRQKRQDFELEINITHDRCRGDAAKIHRALDNIVSNAIKYTPVGGTINYRISELPSTAPGIGRYRFCIADNGVGISREDQRHLFEPFYRGENGQRAEGTGLGLSIAKAIVDLKGGTIAVRSAPGGGTTFTVELPIQLAGDDEREDAGPAATHAAGVCDLSGIRVLLCEDHPVNQRVAVRMLEKVGAAVTVAENGRVGVDAFLAAADHTFQLILMDVRMPLMDGYQATRAIRTSGRPGADTVPIVAMTANAFAEDVQKSMAAGMDGHLAKPIKPELLYETILGFCRPEEGVPVFPDLK